MTKSCFVVWLGVTLLGARCLADSGDVETILEQVEARGAGVNDLRCKVIYITEDRISDDRVKREGEILYKKKDPNPVFKVTFEKTVQEGKVSRKKSWYWFDGRWFYEAKEIAKTIIKRDVAPPGTTIDLFSIDKAPFPIPFGQKKAEILKHFDVTLAPPAAGDPELTDHLICLPKPDSRVAKDYSKLEFFVSRSLHLPIKIVMTANPPDRVTEAEFPELSTDSLNTNLADGLFRQPPKTRRYAVYEE